MNPLRVLVADDEPAARDAIRALLGADPEVLIVGECRNGTEALAAMRAGDVDIVFLDVQMPELDGLSVLTQLGVESPTIVFVTAYDQYALKAFEAHAVEYLLKPFDDERFYVALTHAKGVARRERGGYLQRIPVRRGDRTILLRAQDVDWIQADGDYARIHAGKEAFLIRESITRFAATLDPTTFARIHRSTIVNLDRVRELRPLFKGDHTVVLHDGTPLKLSRHFKAPLERQLGRAL
jgi:two-component system, LytTR family, response regulator